MATSTEATVRDVLVNAIQAIAQTSLGFDDPSGNVRDYPIEMHPDERVAEYLRTRIGGRYGHRAWAVDVRGFDEPYAMRQVAKRTYRIEITGYYAKVAADGSDYHDLIDHARKIRGAVNTISPSLSGTATLIASATGLDVSQEDIGNAGRFIVGRLSYTAERTNPDF